MLAPVQYSLLAGLLALARRVTGAFRLSRRMRAFLCRVCVIELRMLASALWLVEAQGTEA